MHRKEEANEKERFVTLVLHKDLISEEESSINADSITQFGITQHCIPSNGYEMLILLRGKGRRNAQKNVNTYST